MLEDYLTLFAVLLSLGLFLVLMPWLGGWSRIAKEYPATLSVRTRGPWLFMPHLRMPLFPCWAGVGAGKAGVYLEPLFPASLVFRPILLPWSDVTVTRPRWGWRFARLSLGRTPDIPVYLFDGYFRELESRAGHAA